MKASQVKLRNIFDREVELVVPFFQRAYVWTEIEWQAFLEGICEAAEDKNSYFMGSVILKATSSKEEFIIIDGQQRLTTLNIFFKVIFLHYNLDSAFKDIFTKHPGEKIILSHNRNDKKTFEEIVNLDQLKDYKKEVAKNNNILGAYDFFKKNIPSDIIDSPDKIFKVLKNLQFIRIDLEIDDNEQKIFDTINSLGVDLTAAELLKNYFFTKENEQEYKDYWENTFEEDEEIRNYWNGKVVIGRTGRAMIDLFFYAYLQIKVQQAEHLNSNEKERYVKIDDIFNSYKNYIRKELKDDKSKMIKEIREYADIFKSGFSNKVIETELPGGSKTEKTAAALGRINLIIFGLSTTTLIPYILFILKNVEEEEQQKLFACVELYIMRRIITKETAKNYNNFFTKNLIGNDIRSVANFMKKITEDDNKLPSNEDVKIGVLEAKLPNNQTRGILYLLESKIRGDKQSTILRGMRGYEVEHIMPKKWHKNWMPLGGLNDSETAKRDHMLFTLGNLGLISSPLNKAMRDSAWQVKRPALSQCANGIKITEDILKKENWDEEEIKKRANDIAEIILETWSIDAP